MALSRSSVIMSWDVTLVTFRGDRGKSDSGGKMIIPYCKERPKVKRTPIVGLDVVLS